MTTDQHTLDELQQALAMARQDQLELARLIDERKAVEKERLLDELLARIPGAKRDRKAAGYRVPLLLTPDAQKALAGTFFSYKSADDGGLEFS